MSGFLEDLGKGMASSFGNNIVNGAFGLIGNEIAQNNARENFKYQWDNYLSPKAQVKNLAAAGINPAAAMGNQAPVLSSAGLDLPQNPLGGIGTSALTEISNYLLAKANAKKAGADARKSDADADAVIYENELNRLFKRPERVANLISAYKALQLQDDEHSRNQWITAKEKALSELSGINRDTAKKVFDNMDTQIKLENKQREEDIKLTKERQKTEKTSQSANSAAAALSSAQAKTEDATRDYKAFSIDLANHMQGLEYGFNLDTYKQRLEKFAHEVGIAKWTEFMQSVESKDRSAYNAVQRIIMGKGTKEDGKTFWNLVNDGRQLIPFK